MSTKPTTTPTARPANIAEAMSLRLSGLILDKCRSCGSPVAIYSDDVQCSHDIRHYQDMKRNGAPLPACWLPEQEAR